MRFFEELKTAANDVNLELSEKQYEQFIKYMRLVQKWNEKVNLTAITEDEEFIKKHFVDCIKAFKSKAIAELDDNRCRYRGWFPRNAYSYHASNCKNNSFRFIK